MSDTFKSNNTVLPLPQVILFLYSNYANEPEVIEQQHSDVYRPLEWNNINKKTT